MTTVISYHSSDGKSRRCDAICHDAKHPDCVCICGGRNHGGGLQAALGNSEQWFGELVDQSGMPEESREAWRQLITREPEGAPAPKLDWVALGKRLKAYHRKAGKVIFHRIQQAALA